MALDLICGMRELDGSTDLLWLRVTGTLERGLCVPNGRSEKQAK